MMLPPASLVLQWGDEFLLAGTLLGLPAGPLERYMTVTVVHMVPYIHVHTGTCMCIGTGCKLTQYACRQLQSSTVVKVQCHEW
jgi:hypothetical protein